MKKIFLIQLERQEGKSALQFQANQTIGFIDNIKIGFELVPDKGNYFLFHMLNIFLTHLIK
jgi:hypothetical protein